MLIKSLVLVSTLLCVSAQADSADVQDRLLGAAEIRAALSGKVIAYGPKGWADAGIHEEFQEKGIWKGIYYSFGPIPFSGRWSVVGNQLCVSPDRRAIVAHWFEGSRCRSIWRERTSGALKLEHLNPGFDKIGPLSVKITELSNLRR
ncbi:MAG: hypothetical protein J7500_08125 [Sphingomonas sp.]|uniref:hypothetical protein n=1 Tax=Sphingomonas sp. TaxID=28214 RepID=UPI001B2B1DE1|nr:hypothetical protein [Sphingomonas sp.]MBO9622665.1 hypothetical protein [Sphingomonas sp.]